MSATNAYALPTGEIVSLPTHCGDLAGYVE